MGSDKIEDNHSYQKIKKELEGFEALSNFFSSIGKKDAFEKAVNMDTFLKIKRDFESISKTPDRFNSHFAKLGWIAHESMNSDLMHSCIKLAENGNIGAAESELVDYYSTHKMQWLVNTAFGIPELYVRNDLITLAYDDTIARRYHACIPVVLMIIDGFVNDIDKSKGFFAKDASLTAWDSIAGHSTGLQMLKEIFNDTRKKTSSDAITLPYRNGILHGRDLGYANQIVAAKCWAALFAIKDWAHAVKKGKRNPPPPKPELSNEELVKDFCDVITNSCKQHERNKELETKIKEWTPRKLDIGIDVPESGTPNQYNDLTPEKEAILFLEYWEKNNYGNIARQVYQHGAEKINIGQEAARVRNIFEGKKLDGYKIVEIADSAPARSDISILVDFTYDNKQFSKLIVLRFIYQGMEGGTVVFGEKGEWKIFTDSFNKIFVI